MYLKSLVIGVFVGVTGFESDLAVRLTPGECAETTSASLKRELRAAFNAVTFPLEQLRIVPAPSGVVQNV